MDTQRYVQIAALAEGSFQTPAGTITVASDGTMRSEPASLAVNAVRLTVPPTGRNRKERRADAARKRRA